MKEAYMAIYIGSQKPKFYLGDQKVKAIWLGGVKVYSAGNIVTYHVDTGITYQEEVDEGASVLSPTSFTPTKQGWTFIGWRILRQVVRFSRLLPWGIIP